MSANVLVLKKYLMLSACAVAWFNVREAIAPDVWPVAVFTSLAVAIPA
jgi:hypothetical protein